MNLRRGIVITLMLAFAYITILPAIQLVLQSVFPSKSAQLASVSDYVDELKIRSVEVFVVGWFTFVGASIGSFLNVVAGSIASGTSPFFRNSSCPNCGHVIWRRDNLPIVGYLALQGSCRHCQFAIPRRYLWVEIAAGAIIALFFLAELISGGDNLPVRQPNFYDGIVWILLYAKWDLIAIYLYHCSVLLGLLLLALFARETYTPSFIGRTIFAFCLILPHYFFPELNPVAKELWLPHWLPQTSKPFVVICVSLAIACSLGQVISLLFSKQTKVSESVSHPTLRFIGVGWISIAFGWHFAVGVLLVQGCLICASRKSLYKNTQLTQAVLADSLLLATVIHLLLWRWLVHNLSWVWPSFQAPWFTQIAALLVILWIWHRVISSCHQDTLTHELHLHPEVTKLSEDDAR